MMTINIDCKVNLNVQNDSKTFEPITTKTKHPKSVVWVVRVEKKEGVEEKLKEYGKVKTLSDNFFSVDVKNNELHKSIISDYDNVIPCDGEFIGPFLDNNYPLEIKVFPYSKTFRKNGVKRKK